MLHTDAERTSRRPVPPTMRQPAARPDSPTPQSPTPQSVTPQSPTPRPAPATWSAGSPWQLPGDERALAAARARRLVATRRWERRAELATRRAARASSSLV